MGYKKVVLVGTLLFVQSAIAADWVTIAAPTWPPQEGADYYVEVDGSSIRMRDGYRQAWVRYSYARPQLASYGLSYKSVTQLQILDCKNEETANMEVIYYNEKFSLGGVVHSFSVTRSEAVKLLKPVLPQTLGETVLLWTCGQKSKQ